jgi:hypothetical protein
MHLKRSELSRKLARGHELDGHRRSTAKMKRGV